MPLQYGVNYSIQSSSSLSCFCEIDLHVYGQAIHSVHLFSYKRGFFRSQDPAVISDLPDYSDEIIKIAKERKVNAIIPGYGFLSENADFARSVAAAGVVFVGPSPEAIESFGLKHKARELAVKASVPIVPGTEGLIQDEGEAVRESERLGFPVMLKATAGGGGIGLSTCKDVKEVKEAFAMVKSRGENLFKNAGVFIERYYVSHEPHWWTYY